MSTRPSPQTSPASTSVPVSAPRLSSRTPTRPLIGSWDHLEVAVGLRGYGKSTRLVERMLDLDELAGGAYKIGHSLGARLPESLPSGRLMRLHYHKSVRSLATGLRRDPGGVHIVVEGPADDVLHFSVMLSESVRRNALGLFGRGRPTGKPAAPVICLCDEAIAIEAAGSGSSGSRRDDRWFKELVFSIRHWHIALLAGIQNANARSYILLDQATQVHVFRTRHEWALNAIRAAGYPSESLDLLPRLRKYEWITFGGLAEEGDDETDEDGNERPPVVNGPDDDV